MKSPGLLGYYREYVKDFSKIAKLLFDLLKVDSHKDIKIITEDYRDTMELWTSPLPSNVTGQHLHLH